MALDFDTDRKATGADRVQPMSYELPDGHIVELRTERFRCPEVLFQPSLVGKDAVGIHEATFQAIAKCDFDGIFKRSPVTVYVARTTELLYVVDR